MRPIAFLAALLLGSAAQAQGQAPAGPSLLPLVMVFALVLALVPVAIWALKRLGGGQAAPVAGLQVVGQLVLGANQRVVVIEAHGRWLLLGVTAGSINRLGSMPKGELATTAGAPPFAQLLAKLNRTAGQ